MWNKKNKRSILLEIAQLKKALRANTFILFFNVNLFSGRWMWLSYIFVSNYISLFEY